MSGNSFGKLFTVTTFGESHGPAIGCVIDGCPPGLTLSEADIQPELDRRKPGTSRHVTQRQESDTVEILSGVYQGVTTGTPIALLIRNEDQRSKDYGNIAESFRPGHADYTYWHKYGVRDPRGGGRSSARLTAPVVGAAAIAKKWLLQQYGTTFKGCMSQLGDIAVPFQSWDHVHANPFFAASADADLIARNCSFIMGCFLVGGVEKMLAVARGRQEPQRDAIKHVCSLSQDGRRHRCGSAHGQSGRCRRTSAHAAELSYDGSIGAQTRRKNDVIYLIYFIQIN